VRAGRTVRIRGGRRRLAWEGARSRRFVQKRKILEPGHRGEGSDQRLGKNIPGMGNIPKMKINKVSCRQN